MICTWCNGTGKECGCGYGVCVHCNSGVVTTPPIGEPIPMMETEFYYTVPKDFLKKVVDFNVRTPNQIIEYVSIALYGEQRLTEDELKMMYNYWDSEFREESIGEVVVRVMQHIK